jgi:hypothetical protein
MKSTIPHIGIVTDANALNLLGRAKPLYCGLYKRMPSLFGESLLMIADSKGLAVPYSETKANTKAVSLSDRLTQSLISVGLIRGIIPSSMRQRSNHQILASAFFEQGGSDADILKAA